MTIKPILFWIGMMILVFASTLSHGQVVYPPVFGLQDDVISFEAPLRQKVAEIGAKWVRQYVFWSDIEVNAPTNGMPNYDWGKYDSLFADYESLGLTVIALLGGNPSWAAPKPYGPVYPEHRTDFVRFMRDLVERYDGDGIDDAPGSPVVRFFEFFNEPDLNTEEFGFAGPGWGMWGGKGFEYAQMLKDVYPEAKSASPNAMIVFGGLALENIGPDSQGQPIFDPNFLLSVLSSGGGAYFDLINFHYYSLFADVWSPYGKDILGKINFVRNILSAHGLTKPVIITEAGEWSGTPAGRSEEIQAQYVVKLFARSLVGELKSTIWFTFQDSDCSGLSLEGTRGLLRCDGSQKPAYPAYKIASDLLKGVTYQGPLPGVEEGYIFSSGRTKYVYVLWNDSGDLPVSLTITSNQVTQVDKLGNPQVMPVSGNTYNLVVGPDPVYLLFEIPAETVSKPSVPYGPTEGSLNVSCAFGTSGSFSDLGHPVLYQFDWKGDGTDLSSWSLSTIQSKTWTIPGTYFVRVRARCYWNPSVVSFWSSPLRVRIFGPTPPFDYPPFGFFDLPLPDSTISGVAQVGGWALDDVLVSKIELRSDIPFWPYIGDLYYTCGTRPDVKAAYPTYPNNDCGGWGYIWLTNFMSDYRDPQTGQRVLEGSAHQYYLRIYDSAGHYTDVGHRSITIRNDQNGNPFGAIDVPGTGEIVSGRVNVIGWALAKGGRRVSRVEVRFGGQVLGQANYGLYRSDVEGAFPGYADSGGAAYVYELDTTLFLNGRYDLNGLVTDENNNQDGIGSRFIYIQN